MLHVMVVGNVDLRGVLLEASIRCRVTDRGRQYVMTIYFTGDKNR